MKQVKVQSTEELHSPVRVLHESLGLLDCLGHK